ncbi:sulfatase-like hydrolase/transferase [Nucisporomicrobium flavum]|uniref:sulfatase-like hydrolase/transferase n=1 Tax=Nucisporomicrobium flavum TaxID=2785915 RepID=UPI0027DCB9A9|nr:sulfatase-like hydrolase/transferase [Nucisporomicrobium flavum]
MSVSLREVLATRLRRSATPTSPEAPAEPTSPEPAAVAEPATAAAEPTSSAAEPPTAEPAAAAAEPAAAAAEPSRLRRVAGRALTAGAIVLIFAGLIMPNIVNRLERPGTYVRLPIEGFLALGLLLVLPGRWKRIVAGVLGAGLGLLMVEKSLDMGFYQVLARPFDPVLDWVLLDDAEAFLRDSAGEAGAIGALIGVIVLVLAIMSLTTLAALRIARVAAKHRTATARTALAGTAVWVTCFVLGVQVFGNMPVAARASAMYAWDRAHMVRGGLRDEANFAREVKIDAFANVPGDQLLTSLRGKDLLLTFVESYGRSAVEDPAINAGTVEVLDEGTATLAKAGYTAKSGWLTSPTFGGGSWLAHSTLLSGLWINNQQRYRNLTSSERLTLTSLTRKAGFDTMSVMPGATRAWPEGNFYGYNRVYDSRTMGYAGPRFGWGPQPDQYTLSWLQKNVHGPAHSPLFVEMPLVSSHTPWVPIPSMIDWNDVGDGSVYEQIHARAKKPGSVWKDPAKVRHEYARSIQYTLSTLISYLEKFGDDDTVMVFLGDHQPAPIVVGETASHDVPITIVAKDPAVLDKIADWGWTDGLRPAASVPAFPMNQFRDKFLTAYGPSGEVARAMSPPRR